MSNSSPVLISNHCLRKQAVARMAAQHGAFMYPFGMRLALVSVYDPADVNQWSGIPSFVLNELRAQVEHLEVIPPLSRSFRYWYSAQGLRSKITGNKIQIDRRQGFLDSYARQIERALLNKNVDGILALSSIPISHLKRGLPVIFWTDAVYEAMAGYYAGSFSNLTSSELTIAHAQEQAALDRSSFAVYSSSWAAQATLRLYDSPEEKIKVVHFGANLSPVHDTRSVERFVEERLQGECSLLFLGVDWERKGGPIALEATRILNDRGIKTRLKVVGCDAPSAPFVDNLGFISKRTAAGKLEIERLLKSSTFLLFPTRAEAAGIVLCEACAFGLPVVSTSTGGVESYVAEGETGYCLPLSATPAQYADIIQYLLEYPNQYRRLAMNAFDLYKRRLNWSFGVAQIISLFESQKVVK